MMAAAFRTMLVAFTCSIILNLAGADIVISELERTIDLTSQLAKLTTTITLENKGDAAVNEFVLAYEKDAANIAFLEVTDKSDDDVKLAISEVEAGVFKVTLPSSLAKDDSASFIVETVYSHILQPYPAKIAQTEKQQFLYSGNLYFYPPYKVKTQKTTVKLSSSSVESHTKIKPFSVKENVITYGPYKESKAYNTQELKVHYENNSPFLTVNEMTRWIEVSHWGNVAVEETYHMTHEGAQLKGHFSRYDYQRSPAHAAIKSFKTVLPAAARDVYYRDEIGNISTSNMLVQHDSVEVELRPRFPLFGGWQTRYYLGYNVPAYQYLFNKGDKYVLKMRVIDHVFDEFVVDKLNVKIVLPEGCTNIKVNMPFKLTEERKEIHKTYLDTVGRPVVVLTKKNLIEGHIQDLEVHYTFKKLQLLQEPLLCVAAFYILFITVICVVRLDFSITKDAAKESRMKIASLVEELLSACDRRSSIYAAFDAAIDKFKQSRDQTQYTIGFKKANSDYSTLTTTITDICTALVKEDAVVGEKITVVQEKEAERKALVDQASTLAVKVVAGKLGRQQYMESEQTAIAKREKLGEELDNLLSTL
jgi:oligosaccharyltransferase complex subunit alpha (ribophorin I)